MRRVLAASAALLLGVTCARAESWRHFRIMLWQTPTAVQIAALKRLGVDGTKLIANRSEHGKLVDAGAVKVLRAGGMRWYVENIATDFYAAYHRWQPSVPVNAAFLADQRAHAADPSSLAPFVRDPSLSDRVALAVITARLRRTVRAWEPYRPLFYSLGDETGIADLAANWDFDFSPASLAGFRLWLHGQYRNLAALNAEWNTDYADWEAIQPITTTAAMARGNAAPWSDFKAWMDTSFARAVRTGTEAVHAADPQALAAIEGAQIPGWGGYDYAKLADAVDVMEIYDAGGNLAMARSFNPNLILLTTSAETGPTGIRHIWREALRGTRGLILWDDDHAIVQADGRIGPRGREDAATFAALRGPVGDLLLHAPRVAEPVAILASQASFRMRWLAEHRAEGDAWTRHSAADAWDDRTLRAGLDRVTTALRRNGVMSRFVSENGAAHGGLRGLRVLILPDVVALSPQAAAAIARFAAHGGLVIATGESVRFDAHGRRLAKPPPEPGVRLADADVTPARLRALLARAGVHPGFRLAAPDGTLASDVDAYARRDGGRLVLGLQGAAGGSRVTLHLPTPQPITDVMTGRNLGRTDQFALTLDPAVPTLLAIGAR